MDGRYWTDNVINDQMSYFNQMVGFMMAINLSHHYLGHYAKYAPKMIGPGDYSDSHQRILDAGRMGRLRPGRRGEFP